MRVMMDPHAGPCGGVKRALRLIEKELQGDVPIVALGPIIHNQAEMDRLEGLGLVIANSDNFDESDFEQLKEKRVFVRSHGISKSVRQQLTAAGAQLCDGTCPTVSSLQKTVEQYYQDGYQILIVGKPDHPEVIGLNSFCENRADILQSLQDIESLTFSDKVVLLAQTTIAHDKYLAIEEKILQIAPCVVVKDTICRQVSNRHEQMRNFAAGLDVVLLVGGKNSSNTRVLFDIAKQSNPNTFWIERQDDIDFSWFGGKNSIGITGSASTPVWQLEKILKYLDGATFN